MSNIALGPVALYNGATFSCTDNKCDTDPLWVDVGACHHSLTTCP